MRRIRNTTPGIDESARRMRKRPTLAESMLWNALRRKQLSGLKFRRQHALGPYILDFVCPERRLAIEVDGDVHDQQKDYDDYRTEHLGAYGYRMLRFRNEEVLYDLNGVLRMIAEAALSPAPLPVSGEGRKTRDRRA